MPSQVAVPPCSGGQGISTLQVCGWRPAELIHAPVPPHHATFGLSLWNVRGLRERAMSKTQPKSESLSLNPEEVKVQFPDNLLLETLN